MNSGLQISFVIVPELPLENFEEYNDIGIELINEWDLGSPDLLNGIVFMYSLKDGVLVYAAQANAESVLPQATIETLLSDSDFQTEMEAQNPTDALLSFAEKLSILIYDMGEGKINEKIAFQQSYLSYITGGLLEPAKIKDNDDKNINIQGAIRWSEIEIKELADIPPRLPDAAGVAKNFAFGAGYRYAIIFLSYDTERDFLRVSDDDLPPTLAVVFADQAVLGDERYCKIQNY
jgi:hypothetical protein